MRVKCSTQGALDLETRDPIVPAGGNGAAPGVQGLSLGSKEIVETQQHSVVMQLRLLQDFILEGDEGVADVGGGRARSLEREQALPNFRTGIDRKRSDAARGAGLLRLEPSNVGLSLVEDG